MFGRKESLEEERKRHLQSRLRRYKFSQSQGAALTRRLYEIRQLDPASRSEAVQKLFEDARHQLTLIRQMITNRTRYDFSSAGDDPIEGDIAACLAEHVTGFMREHTTAPQTFFEFLSQQLPDVYSISNGATRIYCWQPCCANFTLLV